MTFHDFTFFAKRRDKLAITDTDKSLAKITEPEARITMKIDNYLLV